MGKKPGAVRTATDRKASLTTSPLQNTDHNSIQAQKARAMMLLNEYMRYFGTVNGLYRQVVDVQRDVVCSLGRAAWRTLTQEELDKAFDSQIVYSYMQGSVPEATETIDLFPKRKSKTERRDSMQYITVWLYNSQCFYDQNMFVIIWLDLDTCTCFDKRRHFGEILDSFVVDIFLIIPIIRSNLFVNASCWLIFDQQAFLAWQQDSKQVKNVPWFCSRRVRDQL